MTDNKLKIERERVRDSERVGAKRERRACLGRRTKTKGREIEGQGKDCCYITLSLFFMK